MWQNFEHDLAKILCYWACFIVVPRQMAKTENIILPSGHTEPRLHLKKLNGLFLASFSLFSSFQCTVASKQMFYRNKFLKMTGFNLRTSGIRSNHSTNWATTTSLVKKLTCCKRIALKRVCNIGHCLHVVGRPMTTFSLSLSLSLSMPFFLLFLCLPF